MVPAIINTILGLFLMVAPAFFSFSKVASNNTYVVAPLIITFAITAIWEVNRSTRYFNIVAGAWLVIAPFVLDYQSSVEIWTTILSGAIIAALSLVRGEIKGKYGGGWRSLFQSNPPHLHQADESR